MAENTALIEVHKELEAKMAPVNNWNLPLFYPGGTVAEHRHCRKAAGLFDLGDRIIARIAGDLSVLDKMLSVPASKLLLNSCKNTLWLKPDGTIGADLTVCKMSDNDCLLLFGRGVSAAAVNSLAQQLPDSVQFQVLTGALSSFMLLGKRAGEVMAANCEEALPAVGNWAKLTFCDEDEEFRAITLHLELFGEDAWIFIFNAEFAADLYEIFYRDVTVMPCGLTAFESLRIESLTPAFASEFINRTPEQCSADGDGKIRMIAAAMPRHPAKPGDNICDAAGNVIGTVTSGAFCPADDTAKIIGFVNAGADIATDFGGNAGTII